MVEEMKQKSKLRLSHAYEKETQFSQELTQNLKTMKIKSDNQETGLTAQHNTKQGRKRIPDITVETKQKIEMKYRELSSPFYIECKLGNENKKNRKGYSSLKQVHDNLMQLLKYNYEDDSQKVKDLEKYGDRHVAVTTPLLLKERQEDRNFKQEYINLPQLIRTLWKLGLGIFYKDRNGKYKIAFNEQEVVYLE